jgi:hypothetical protein
MSLCDSNLRDGVKAYGGIWRIEPTSITVY